jgi:ferric-dicitrate binding protein FerR (iron transport regulator)
MLPDDDRLIYLFHQYLNDNTSEAELEELFQYIRETRQNSLWKQQITEVFRQVQPAKDFDDVDWDLMFSRIIGKSGMDSIEQKPAIKRLRLWKSVAAALLILLLGGSAYMFFHRQSSSEVMTGSGSTERDIMPGGNKAVLTLANGTRVMLDSIHNGKLASQGSINVVKATNGLLAYIKQNEAGRKQKTMQYNMLTTPRGGQYQLTLSDGTKVWLNAASSIRYPVVFTGDERKVEITGEAYFEVVHNEGMPFRVQAGDEIIEDLGTHFNVNAYAEEPGIRTTLLEGSVKIGNIILKPGEQAVLEKNGHISVSKNADMDDVIAWKNGFFAFNNANLQTVMQKLSRWYDIDVVYEPGVNNEQRFSGRIDRSLTLSQILNGLKQTRAHFRIEADRKVVILP